MLRQAFTNRMQVSELGGRLYQFDRDAMLDRALQEQLRTVGLVLRHGEAAAGDGWGRGAAVAGWGYRGLDLTKPGEVFTANLKLKMGRVDEFDMACEGYAVFGELTTGLEGRKR